MTTTDTQPAQQPAQVQRETDLAVLATGGITGWWDETGQPAPFPDDFFDPDSDWRPSTANTPPELPDGEQPF